MRKKYKILIILGITGACFIAGFLVFNKSSLSDSAVGFVEKNEKETKEIKESEDKPVCLSGSIEPKKVASGDEVIVTVEIKDNYGIEKVIADMGGIETIELNRIMKQSSNETIEQWQGRWLAHSTEPKNYQTMVYATNVLGKQSSMSINWEDPSITDAFTDESKIATSTNITVTGGQAKLAVWSCGSTLTDSRDNKTYATVLIGSQCWMKQCLNVGTATSGVKTQGTDCPTAAAIEKYCYLDTVANCDSTINPSYPDGGLYQWAQAMCGSIVEGVKGICPTGWHFPTRAEFATLITYLGGASVAGTKLQPGGTSGFEGNLAGLRSSGGSFYYRTAYGLFWSSTQYDETLAWDRELGSGYGAAVYEANPNKTGGFSVRCLKD